MVTLAAGMESDISDDECDIVYSSQKESSENKVQIEPEKKVFANGQIGNSIKNGSAYNSRGSAKVHPQNRSQNQHMRRQCLDFKSSQAFDDLRYAIISGNLELTKEMFSKGIWIDTILKDGWTGLMYACSSGRPDLVSFFLEEKADPNFHKDMFTPLIAVCAAKKLESDLLKCCELLIQHGANVNAHERHFTTPLMFAVREGYSLIVKELLDHEADPNKQDNRGNTALLYAASGGHGQILRLLIEKGAHVNLINNMGQSPADLALEQGHEGIFSLLQKGSLLLQNSGKESSLTLVAKDNHTFNEISKLTRPGDAKTYAKVGELELFLSGIDSSDLIPIFKEHQLNFHDLLVMDEDELEKMGISQIGVRKKILEACQSVHKKEWQNSSLPNLKQKQYISCPDAVAMMGNIAKHLKYISSSVIYIRQQIQQQPRILELSQDSANVHNLLDEMEDGLKNVRFLNDEMRFLKMHLEKVQNQLQYIPADIIVETIPTYQNQKLMYITIGITAISAVVAGFLWKNPGILESIPTKIRIRIPFLT